MGEHEQQTGECVMRTCKDCGGTFAARKRSTHRVCPECVRAHKRECNRRLHDANHKRYRADKTAMQARLAARDAEFERGGHAAEARVTVRDGLRIETRGRVCGSPVGGARRIAI